MTFPFIELHGRKDEEVFLRIDRIARVIQYPRYARVYVDTHDYVDVLDRASIVVQQIDRCRVGRFVA